MELARKAKCAAQIAVESVSQSEAAAMDLASAMDEVRKAHIKCTIL